MTEIVKYTISDAKIFETEGQVEAYVNTMGVRDHDGDIIDPEAFNASIKANLPIPVLSGHDQKQIVGKVVFARAEELEAPEHRLLARIQMNMDTQIGREAFSNIAGDFVREWSVGFNIPGPDAVDYEKLGKETIRRIKNLDWVEVSSVIRGASPATMTIAAKSDNPDEIEEVEDVITETIEITETSEPSPDDTEEAAAATDEQSAADALTRIALLRTRLRLKEKLIA
jgi:HK97 family phage prohead protease